MPASTDQNIVFCHEFKLSVERFDGVEFDDYIDLPPFAMVHNSSHIRLSPIVIPNGYFGSSKAEVEGCFVGFRLLDEAIHHRKTGVIILGGFIRREDGEIKKLGVTKLGSTTRERKMKGYVLGQTELGKDLDEVKSNGYVFPDNTIRGQMRVKVPEKLFDLDCCFPQFEAKGKGLSEMLDDIVSGRNDYLPDFVLRSSLDETQLKCHRSVLALVSEYFRGIFHQGESQAIETRSQAKAKRLKQDQSDAANESLANLSESSSPSIFGLMKIEKESTSLGFSGGVLEKVRHWMYKGEDSFEWGAVPPSDVLAAADILQLLDLKSYCEKRLIADVTGDNAWELLKLSDTYKLEILENRALAVLANSPGVLNWAKREKGKEETSTDKEKEEKLKEKLVTFLQEGFAAHKIMTFP